MIEITIESELLELKTRWKNKFTPKLGLINWNQMWTEIEKLIKKHLKEEGE